MHKEQRVTRSRSRSQTTPSSGQTTTTSTSTWSKGTSSANESSSMPKNNAPRKASEAEAPSAHSDPSIPTPGAAPPGHAPLTHAPHTDDEQSVHSIENEQRSNPRTLVGVQDDRASQLSVLMAELEVRNAELQQAQLASAAARSRLEIARIEASQVSSMAAPGHDARDARVLGWVAQQQRQVAAIGVHTQEPLYTPPRNEPERPSEFVNRDLELLSHRVVDAVTRNRNAPMASRQSYDLPHFEGSPQEWIAFRAEYEDSAPMHSDVSNISRLRRALRGEAKIAVKSIMYTAISPAEIIGALERHFGDPEEIILNEIHNVKRMPRLAEDNSNIISFAGQVANVVATIKSLKQNEFLYAPELVNKIVDKMNLIVRYEWNKYRVVNKGTPGLVAMALFLNEISSATRKSQIRKTRANVHTAQAHYDPAPLPLPRMRKGRRAPQYDEYYSDSEQSNSDYDEPRPLMVAQLNQNRYTDKRKPVEKRFSAPPAKNTPARAPQPIQTTSTYVDKCVICRGEHKVSECSDFNKMSVTKRLEAVKNGKLCFRCLQPSHKRGYRCKYVACGIGNCEAGHHRLLHGMSARAQPTPAPRTGNVNHVYKMNTYLKVVPVELNGPLGTVETFCLLDGGSSISLIERHIADQIAPRDNPEPLSIEGVGGNCTFDRESCRISVTIRGAHTRNIEKFTAYTIEKLNLPEQTVSRDLIEQCDHLREIEEQLCYDHAVPTIIIGQDHWELIVSKQILQGKKDLPVASRSKLGWQLHGSHDAPRNRSFLVSHVRPTPAETEITALMKEHFSIECLGVEGKLPKTDPNQRAIDILDATCRKLESEDRYEAGLLWCSNDETLPNNENLALRRLHSLEKKLNTDEKLKVEYCKQIDDLLIKGYAEVAQGPAPLEYPRKWILPHFPVFHAQKGSMRLVFDAKAKAQNKSLNDALLPGPDFLRPLFGVLLKFREGKIGIVADIKHMFLQIQIPECDRDSLRFYWREANSDIEPKEYRMKRLIFGSASSPSTALYVKNKNANTHRERYPIAADLTIKNSYMDDFLVALDEDVDTTRQIVNDLYELNKKASFELRGFASNRPEVISDVVIPSTDESKTLGKCDTERTLGLIWNHKRDTIGFNVNLRNTPTDVLDGTKLPTKRQVTSSAMSIFDPMGYISPVSVIGKILIQDIWRTGIGWDETIRPESVPLWNAFITSIQQLKTLEIDRYVPATNRAGSLHVFCDASEKIYAAAVYFVSHDSEGEAYASLIVGKARAAPLKVISIPRLELQSCVLGTRLAKSVLEHTDYVIEKCHFWSDSRTVLTWIKSDPRSFKSFVAHRIAEIEESTTTDQWRWVPSAQNIADVATKGIPKNFNRNHTWFVGPDFIRRDSSHWPTDKSAPSPPVDTGEERPQKLVLVASKSDKYPYLPDISRFSKYSRLVRATATVVCAAEVFKAMILNRNTETDVRNDHIKIAELLLIKRSQHEYFNEEIKLLEAGRTLPKKSTISKLAVKLNSNGLLLLDGRTDRKQAIPVLHAREPFTRLLLAHYHAKFNHGNHATVMNELHQRYHIVGLRGALRFICNNCQWCRTYRAKPAVVPPGDIPKERMTANQPAFTSTACDLFGPIVVTVGRRHEKRWGVLYTCLTTRAVHIELAASLSGSSMILSLRRMMARRGTPSVLYTDNATNFLGAEREISDAMSTIENEMKSYAISKQIIWKKIPPGNPAAGGAWERLVGSIKAALKVTLCQNNPHEEVLHTLLLEAEHIVNSRPLIPVMLNDNQEALTPNHFLIGRSNAMSPFGYFSDVTLSPSSWKTAQALAENFWKRWVTEYRHTLRPRTKTPPHENVKIGDIVLIADNTMPRGIWPRGEVVNVHPGPDGKIRSTEVRTAAGYIRRPASRLIVIS